MYKSSFPYLLFSWFDYRGLGLEKFVLDFDPTEHTTPARVQANMHGKTRAGVVCFSLERKMDFASPWHL